MDNNITNNVFHAWHPWSNIGDQKINIVKGEGVFIFDNTGKRYLDAKSCAANASCGYSNTEIIKSMNNQAYQLMNTDFQYFDSEIVQNLSNKIYSYLPKNLNRMFFTSSGSEAVEMAIKTVFDYRKNTNNKNKKYILSFSEGYHGTTFMTTLLSGISHVKNTIVDISLFRNFSINNMKNNFYRLVNELDVKNISAFILEPILGVGGYHFLNYQDLDEIIEFCSANDILVIVDETLTSFGRTGKMFAFESYICNPDILIAGKGLTGGYFPYAVTIVDEKIYQSYLNDDNMNGICYGHTNSGHTLGAAIALTVIDIIENKKLVSNSKILGDYLLNNLSNISSEALLNIRGEGLFIAFDLYNKIDSNKFERKLIESGLILKKDANSFAIIPPLNISKDECNIIIDIIKKTIKDNSIYVEEDAL